MTAPAPAPVLFAIPRSELGGAQRSLVLLLRALDRAAFPPFVLLGETGPLARTLESLGVRHEVAPASWKSVRGVRDFDRVLRRESSRVLHLYGARTLALVARARGLAVVERVNLLRGPEQGGLVARPFLDRQLLRLAHLVQVPSEAMRAQLLERGVPAAKLRLVPNGVWLEPAKIGREGTRKALGIAEETFVIQSVGRLVALKGFADLVGAIENLRSLGLDVALLIAGEGPERAALEAQAREANVADRVKLLGDREDVADLLAAADVYVQASRTEVLSNALLEAMAAGKPVLATNVGGTAEVVEDGKTGILIPPATPAGLTHFLRPLAQDRAGTRARLEALGAAAKARIAATRSLEAMARATEAVYREALALAGGAS